LDFSDGDDLASAGGNFADLGDRMGGHGSGGLENNASGRQTAKAVDRLSFSQGAKPPLCFSSVGGLQSIMFGRISPKK
jgi:hypothetical protein